jgi:hypothetical protein
MEEAMQRVGLSSKVERVPSKLTMFNSWSGPIIAARGGQILLEDFHLESPAYARAYGYMSEIRMQGELHGRPVRVNRGAMLPLYQNYKPSKLEGSVLVKNGAKLSMDMVDVFAGGRAVIKAGSRGGAKGKWSRVRMLAGAALDVKGPGAILLCEGSDGTRPDDESENSSELKTSYRGIDIRHPDTVTRIIGGADAVGSDFR